MKKRVVLALLLCFSMAFGMSGCGIGSAIMKAEEIAEQKAAEEVKEEIEELPEEIIEEEVEEEIEEVIEEVEEEVEEKDNKKPLKAPTSGTLSDDIYDFQISIDGFVYQIPVLYEDMVANGYSCEDDEDELPSMNYSLADVVKFGGSKMYVQFMNFDINSAPKKDGYIVQMSIEADELDDNNEVVLAQGIKLNESTYDDIKAAYGEASDVYEGSIYNKYTYKKDIYSDIDLYCDLETGKLIEIEMQNIVEPEDFVTSEISDEVPEIVGSYEAPTKMSDNALDYIVEYELEIRLIQRTLVGFIPDVVAVANRKGSVKRLTSQFDNWEKSVAYLNKKHEGLFSSLGEKKKRCKEEYFYREAAYRVSAIGDKKRMKEFFR